MTRPLSTDLRERLISAVDGGMSRRAAAERFGVGEATAIRWVERYRRTGRIEPEKMGPRSPRSPLEAYREEILSLVESRPDITLAEIVAHLGDAVGLKTSTSSVDRFLARNAITFKKRQRTPANRSAPM
ncbi:transposase [Labrenzia sp. EL_195]|nr:transposase [Labrenzia sp. EL_195]